MHCIPFGFSQCFMNLDLCFFVEKLSIDRFGLGWTHDAIFFCISHVHAFFMYTYPFFSIFWYSVVMVLFCLSPSLPFLDSLSMAPKRKPTPSQNPLRSRASSSNPTPFHIQFCDEKGCQDFLENFSKRGIHSECCVILPDFFYTTLPMSFTIEDGNPYVRYPWVVPPWSYRSSTPICMVSIPLYLGLLWRFKVHIL